ncbi:MAG: TolC family protein [Acidobacteria bacterium]|nr:TolC family protein [Acidobacteriota bacterium]
MTSVLLLLLAQQPMSMSEAVNQALTHYAAVNVSDEQVRAAAAAISLARTNYLPRADFYGQVNRASRNNVFGLMLPQSTLPSISGPPRPENDMASVWGSAVGLQVSWEPFDLGLRKALVASAEAGQRRSEASLKRTRYEVAALTADAYLTVLAAQETVVAARAAVARATTLEQVAQALARADLRPGADASRAKAERSVAETQVIQAEQAVAVAQAHLAQFTGAAGQARHLGDPPGLVVPSLVTSREAHPVVTEQAAVIDEVKAKQKALDKSYAPKFAVQGATYARGTGAVADGTTLGGANGLGPNIMNYALGLTVTFPAMAQPAIRAEQSAQAARERAEAARLKQLQQDLAAQQAQAQARLDGARRTAAQLPVQLEAAQMTLNQATARYRAGLGLITEVAEAQRLVAQAESDMALVRLAIWRGLLQVATAQGDLRPFLTETDARPGRDTPGRDQ